jgi:hypothetical protein
MKLTAPFLLPIIFQLLLIDDSNANLLEKSLLDDSQSDRLLADCPYQYQYFYKTFITMIDSYENNPISCSASQLTAIGAEINKYYDAAVMQETVDLVVMDTTVCPKATTSGRRHLRTEETQDNERDLLLKSTSYTTWAGRGTCRLCSTDNKDRRMMFLDEDERDDSSTDGRQLQTNYSFIEEDFSKDSAGNPLTVRNYVKYEWRNKYGMTVIVNNTNGFAPEGRARIFNTANVTGGAHGLGAPNQKCDIKRNPPFPGQGRGGEPGMPGENCVAQGNVLII